MVAAYRDVDEFLGRLKGMIGDDTFLLVVSDHGMTKLEGTRFGGKHTDYAFYSVNRPIGLVKPRITDFFDLCRSWLGE